MKKTKGKRRIRYGKLTVFLILMAALLFLSITAAVQGFNYVMSHFSKGDENKPSYYLIVGIDDRITPEADAIMVAAVNNNQKELTLISIPGNTKVNKDKKTHILLKSTFSEGNIEETRSAVENLLHVRINKYAVFDYQKFQSLLDKIGPVDLYVEKMMSHDDADGNSEIFLNQGYRFLDSKQSLGYMRYIDAADGEIGRIQREERFLKKILTDMKENTALFNWGLTRYYWEALDTDLNNAEMAVIAYDITKFPMENCRFVILPGELQNENNQKIWIANPIETQKIIGLTLNENPS